VLSFLGARATRGVEEVTVDTYRRTFRIGEAAGRFEVRWLPERNELVAKIHHAGPLRLIGVAEKLRSMFDLEADPDAIARGLGHDRRLRRALRALPGVRVPGTWDGFEVAVRAILGQQVSVAAATTLAGRVAEACGDPLPADLAPAEGPDRLFPGAERLAGADLRGLGLTGARERAIRALAEEVASGRLSLDPTPDAAATVRQLVALPGIGPWTAEYIAMRALREPDAFPETDLGLLRALDLTPRALAEAAEAWRPWRAYAALLLWQSAA
jgi:AraC family transcriptional regulator of adaptative response / DNA-3-methyladenine glycosylase II